MVLLLKDYVVHYIHNIDFCYTVEQDNNTNFIYIYIWLLLVAQMVKHLPTMWETWVRSPCWEVLWRRQWHSTPVLLPRKIHGWRSLVGYSPWGHKELDTTLCICVYIYTHIYIYTHTHIHVYVYTYIYRNTKQRVHHK